MDVFHFSQEQRAAVEGDLSAPPDIVELFSKIRLGTHKRQFFILARTIVWCDGVYHAGEVEALERITAHLGDGATAFKAELEQLEIKPDNGGDKGGADTMMKDVVRRMIDFYKDV